MLTIKLFRHISATDIKDVPVPNRYRHLNIAKAQGQAVELRNKLGANGDVTFRGHSIAPRAWYTLMFTTIGLCDLAPIKEIPNLFPLDDDDGKTIMSACGKQGLNPSKWDADSQEALKRFGRSGAASIRQALADAGVTDGTVLIATHGPMINAQTAALLGGSDEIFAEIFKIDTGEGDQFVIEMLPTDEFLHKEGFRFVPLAN